MDKSEKKAPLVDGLLKVQANLDAGLKRGLDFADLFRVLTTTTDRMELLNAANRLFSFVVDSDSVLFPKKFEGSDYYLIFMTRLIELSGLKTNLGLETSVEKDHQILLHTWKETDQKFRFEIQNGAANYVDQNSKQTIFSLDLKTKKMSFETDTINDTYFLNKVDNDKVLNAEVELFTKFGHILEDTYDFAVDFNMFETRNNTIYEFEQLGLKTDITDQLFIDSAQNHFTLLNSDGQKGGFLQLNNQVIFSIFQEDSTSDQWAIQITDPEEKYSLFSVFKRYDFLNEWYVRNIQSLKLKMKF
ncbi:hypothetical protein FEZ51_04600 [Pediococcus stilesii]|uniref:Uncharacterized protein n=1 Tax=Pediococcus stilesii TaxID=331679 RepID=A0A5R9BX79_9LACO|nr:hypothetical protein [Pediococcus stilesii]TLQ04650.1 hypothetical protein FEZ51_04600 [Pediococcus stilesii]